MLFNQHFEVDLGVVCEQKQYARDEELVVSIVNLEPVGSFCSVPQVNEGLSGRFIEKKSVRKTP